jgi:hypothetical protein
MEDVEKRKTLPLPELELKPFGRQVAIPTELSRFP